MKKDLLALFSNLLVLVCITALCVNIAPRYAKRINEIGESVQIFAPTQILENISSINWSTNDNPNNTTSEADVANNGIAAKDSDLYSSITATPKDIQALMTEAEKSIAGEEQIGLTSEEEYFGGGTLISYDAVEVQSKIPTSFYNLDIESLLNQKAELSISDMSKPTILVYHSHTTEAYTLLDVGYYTESLDLRSDDNSKNMVRVGDELVWYLEKQGFNVIHDTEIHDTNYNGAYDSSRESVERYLEEYPSIEITIDVHRDDITYQNKTKVKPTTEINGKKAARMMIISGCEYNSVKNFPNWESNLKFNLAIQNRAAEMYPGLMRPILFSERRYNMFETKNSFLLEIGTDGNTLDEACYSARLFATVLGSLLLDEYVGGNDEN